MRDDEHLLFFAHARSGSSSLHRILQAHPQLNLLEEPFNENFVTWHPDNEDYLARIKDEESLDEVLNEIFVEHNGLKVLEYQLGSLNRHLLLRDDFRVLFLRRRNLLQAIVSLYVAGQTKLWKMWERERPVEDYYTGLEPLDIDRIARYLTELPRTLESVAALLDQRDRTLSLVYEDLYFGSPVEQHAQLQAVWNFLELAPMPDDEVAYYLSRHEQKINSRETYRRLPNADEINDRFGSDETGWLYDGPDRSPGLDA